MRTLITIYFFFIISVGISGCGRKDEESPRERKEGWTEIVLLAYKDSCTREVLAPSANYEDCPPSASLYLTDAPTPPQARAYCGCIVDEISYRFSIDEFYYYTCTVVDKLTSDGVYDSCERIAKGL